MVDASYTQTSFLAGEISQWAQGGFDKPYYKMALAKALNIWPSDEGPVSRRPGSRFLGSTRLGQAGRLIPLDFSQAAPYDLEFTDAKLRMWNETRLVKTNDSQVIINITNASPAVFKLSSAVTWASGETVTFTFQTAGANYAGANLLNRQFLLTMLTPTTFTVREAITNVVINSTDLLPLSNAVTVTEDGPISSGPISDSAINAAPTLHTLVGNLSPTVNHILEIPTPYTQAVNDWHSIRLVQGYNVAALLHTSVAPQALLINSSPTATNDATFTYIRAPFVDGPYLDPPASAVATPSAAASVIQLTMGYTTWSSSTIYGISVLVSSAGQDYISLVNNNFNQAPASSPAFWRPLTLGSMVNSGRGFMPSDDGRMIRLFYAPPIWATGTTYSAGQNVTFNGAYFTSLVGSNTNNQPDISTADWAINTAIAYWTWGFITNVNTPNSVTVQLQSAILLDTTPILTWRLGAWSDTTGWPTCGCYQEGRFWYGGAIPNRFDGSQPGSPFAMAPTGQDGTVADSNGISYTLNANEQNPIFSMEPDHQGILIFTQEGEFLLSSGTQGAPMTPSNIQAHRQTKYGSANILPVRTGLTICFVKRYARRLYEYLADVFSQRFFGSDLTQNARHLGARGIEELAYQEELIPTVWARCTDGSLIGTTYRRNSLFSTQPPEFNGWHQHTLGSSRFIESLVVGPSVEGTLDAVALVTNDLSSNVRYVERMTTLLDETATLQESWFLDCAVTPPGALLLNNNVIFRGLNYLNGKKVSVFAAGIDCGDYVVVSGQVSVPLGTIDPITGMQFNTPQFQLLQPLIATFSDMAVAVIYPDINYSVPCVIGFNYESQGQLCRPQIAQDTGAKNGPGFGKKRRSARYAIQLVNSLGVRVGTKLSKTKPVPVTKVDAGGGTLNYLETYSGIIRETLEDDFSYDSMLAFKTTRPYPATVTAFGAFIETEDV